MAFKPMKRLALALAVALIGSPALAANDTITVTLTTQAAGCSAGCSRVMNGPSGVNLLPLIVSTYQQACNTAINGTCTSAQVISYWAGLTGSNLKSDIYNAQVSTATTTATSGVTQTPIQ